MTCQEFLARHAEYMDDPALIDGARWEAHMTECAACARYDHVVRQGVRLVRAFSDIEPSMDFFPRLQHRIYHLEDELRASSRGPGTGAMVSLAIAGVLALLAWSPLLRLDQMLLPSGNMAGALTTSEEVAGAAVGRSAAGEVGRGSIEDRPGAGMPSISEPSISQPHFSEPSSLRQVRLVNERWVAPRQMVDELRGGWVGAEIFDEFAHGFERVAPEPRPAPNGPVWWWTGTKFTEPALLRHNPGMMVAPRLPGPYSSQLTSAERVRPTGDTVQPHH